MTTTSTTPKTTATHSIAMTLDCVDPALNEMPGTKKVPTDIQEDRR